MEKSIIFLAIRNRKVTIFFVLAAVLAGLYAYYLIPKQENPDMSAPFALITVIFPGASPEEVEEKVTRKIEDELVSIAGYDYSESFSRNSISKIVLRLDSDADVQKAWAELRQKMDDIQGTLPEGCSSIDVNTKLADTAGLIISLSGVNYTYEQLTGFAEEIKNELTGIRGISRLEIAGKQEKEVRVEVDIALLNQTRLSLEDVVKVLTVQNTEIPSGNIRSDGMTINVNTPGRYKSLQEIENTIMDFSPQNGSVLRLKDVARVFMADEDSNYKIKHNGNNAVLLTGYFQDNKNIVPIGKEAEKRLAGVKKRLPTDLNT